MRMFRMLSARLHSSFNAGGEARWSIPDWEIPIRDAGSIPADTVGYCPRSVAANQAATARSRPLSLSDTHAR